MEIVVEPLDLATASEDDLLGAHEVERAIERSANVPEALVTPPQQGVLDLRHAPANVQRDAFVVRDGGRIVGVARCEWEDAPDNRDHVRLAVGVLPSRCRRGLGGALLAAAAGHAAERFCARLLDVEARRDDPAVAGFLTRFGFEARLASPRNVLWTRDIDRGVLRDWIDRAVERAPGYELVTWDGPCPDRLLGRFLDLWHVMNTAPLDDLEWEDEVMTPGRWRALEAHWAARGITPWTVAARHVPTGELAGFTVLLLHEHRPAVAEQEDTGVRTEHRGRGLGRWLKAVNALRLLAERPEVEAVTTWNAGSNEPMLAINHAMGFRPLEWWAEWQAETERVREALGWFSGTGEGLQGRGRAC